MTDYTLAKGPHKTAADGRCAMEWVAYLAGEPHSDEPICVSPLLRVFCVSFNDALPTDTRQRLRPYLARTIGTAGDGLDTRRARMAVDWLIRVYAPTWLSVAGLDGPAEGLRALPSVLTIENLTRPMDELRRAQQAVAARDAVSDVGWRAALDAAADTISAAAGASAGAAASDVTWDTASAAARGAARDAAWDTGFGAARAAARDAASDPLAPTIIQLQASTFRLLDRMLPTVPLQLPVAEDAESCGFVTPITPLPTNAALMHTASCQSDGRIPYAPWSR